MNFLVKHQFKIILFFSNTMAWHYYLLFNALPCEKRWLISTSHVYALFPLLIFRVGYLSYGLSYCVVFPALPHLPLLSMHLCTTSWLSGPVDHVDMNLKPLPIRFVFGTTL